MDDLISRKAAIEHMKSMAGCATCNNYNEVRCRACSWDDAMEIVDEAPAVDAVPVEWLEEQRDKLSEAWDEEWHEINGLIEQWREEQEAR